MPTSLDEDASESDENSDEDSYESETSESEEEYGYTIASKEEYEPPVEIKKKAKTKGGKQGLLEDSEMANDEPSATTNPNSASEWTQIQQKELELAIKSFPKGTEERWDRIASKVGGKTKEECLLRFKYLATMVKNKKAESPS